jgi:hypothetical protein
VTAASASGGEAVEVDEKHVLTTCIFHVPDRIGDAHETHDAHSTLPRNLQLKQSREIPKTLGVFALDYIPKGVRFGPLVGATTCYDVDKSMKLPSTTSSTKTGRSDFMWKVSRLFRRYYHNTIIVSGIQLRPVGKGHRSK